ncbi:MAG: L,D-transpeptidase family protein [Sphingosinicella sp.]|nr:L,D-transpeptidase family protein [Sphingosinicella sp.]
MARTIDRLMRVLLFSSLLCLAPVQQAAAREAPEIEKRIATLGPGQFIWEPEGAEAGQVEIVISLGLQKAYIFRSGTLIGASTISSGRPGYESPIGRFEILQKKKMHRSNRYEAAPMPYMQRLNWYGVALHAGQVPGHPASHGCIRLPAEFARKLFEVTQLGSFVFVAEGEINSPKEALDLARANALAPVPRDRTPGGAQS